MCNDNELKALKRHLEELKKVNRNKEERKRLLKQIEEEEIKHLTGFKKLLNNALDYIRGGDIKK